MEIGLKVGRRGARIARLPRVLALAALRIEPAVLLEIERNITIEVPPPKKSQASSWMKTERRSRERAYDASGKIIAQSVTTFNSPAEVEIDLTTSASRIAGAPLTYPELRNISLSIGEAAEDYTGSHLAGGLAAAGAHVVITVGATVGDMV